jgi:autotransporter-associated beta strand protein
VQFLSTSVLKVGSGSAELRLRGTNTGANTLAHVINDLGGVTTVTKLDSGAWILSGANTFSGGVTINGGILQVNAAETPGTSGPLGKSGAITNSGGTLQYSAANNFDYSSRFSSGVNQIIKIDCNAQNVTFASTIGNSGSSLTVSSSTPGGSLTLLGVNSNITTVASGTLLVNGDSSAPTNNYTVASGATLGGTGKIGGTVTYQSGSLAAFTNGATLIISGSLVANGNTVHLRLPAALGAGTYTLATYNPTGGSGSFATNPVIDSGSLAAGTSASITTGGGTVSLVICSASANPVTYTATKGLQFKLNESDLLTNATGSGGVNLTSVQSPSANGVSITRSGGIIFYNGPLTNDDSFTYTVTSGTGGCTAANTVTMRAVNGLGPAQIAAPSNGVVTITFFGIPGYSYAVDTTTDVIVGAWSAIETNIAGTNGSWIFTDLNATNAQQYYRLRQP